MVNRMVIDIPSSSGEKQGGNPLHQAAHGNGTSISLSLIHAPCFVSRCLSSWPILVAMLTTSCNKRQAPSRQMTAAVANAVGACVNKLFIRPTTCESLPSCLCSDTEKLN